MIETKYIPYELAQAINEAGIDDATSELVYCDCPEWDNKKPLEISRSVAGVLKAHSHKANIYPRYSIDEALRLMRESLNIHVEIHVNDNGKWTASITDMNDYNDDQEATSENDKTPSSYVRSEIDEECDSYDDIALCAIHIILMLINTDIHEDGKLLSEDEYAKFCANAENMQVYDGRGVYDLYRCDKCGHSVVTTYADKGVTPFTMRCDCCDGTMVHTSSSANAPIGITVLKWVRPAYSQYCELSAGMRQHVENGGLILERKTNK